jgi:hypothetical protein
MVIENPQAGEAGFRDSRAYQEMCRRLRVELDAL